MTNSVESNLIMDWFQELDLLLESLSPVLSVDVRQSLIVQILQPAHRFLLFY